MLGFGKIKKKVFGTANDRLIKATQPIIDKINALEPEYSALDDAGLITKTEELKDGRPRAKALKVFFPRLSQTAARVRDARWDCVRLTCN